MTDQNSSGRLYHRSRPFGIREWMGGRWWLALGVAAIVSLALRSGTVGAPAQASVRPLDSLPRRPPLTDLSASPMVDAELPRGSEQIALEQRLRDALRELERTQSELEIERERSAVLHESYRGLDDQFSQVTELIRSGVEPPTGGSNAAVHAPVPVEAIYVIDPASPARPKESQ